MKRNSIAILLLIASFLVVQYACKPDPKPSIKTGTINLSVKNKVGEEDLVLQTKTYTNQAGESFTLSVYKYYLTNFIFTKDDGTQYKQAESYYLIDATKPESLNFSISEIPEGNYKSVSFMIGIDEPRNTSGAQTGALSPANGMIWNWNTGYIMAKLEGASSVSPAAGFLEFHIGGFKGTYAAQKTITLNFPNTVNISSNSTRQLQLKSDVLEWFKTPKTLSFATTNTVTEAGVEAKEISDNYADMMSIISVQ